MKILIVEDEKISQKKMEVIMSKYGFCDTYTDGSVAIDVFKNKWLNKVPFDIVMLDITLQGMSGLDVLMEIRKFEKENNIPPTMKTKVIMVTSHSDPDHVNSSALIGTDGYVVKPFSSESISRSLKNVYLKYIQEAFSD